MKKLLLSFGIAICNFSVYVATASDLNVVITPPATVGVCMTNDFIAVITPGTGSFFATGDLHLEITGIIPGVANTNCYTGTSANAVSAEVDQAWMPPFGVTPAGSQYNAGVFSVDLTISSSTVSSITLDYDVYIDCSVVPPPSQPAIVMNYRQTWTATLNTINQICDVGGDGNNFDQINDISYVYVSYQSALTPMQANYGDEIMLSFLYIITNVTATTDIIFNFELPTATCTSYEVLSGLTNSYFIFNGGSATSLGSSNPITIPAGCSPCSLTVYQKVRVTGCLPCAQNNQALFKWHCAYNNGLQFCEECQHQYYTDVPIIAFPYAGGVRMQRTAPLNNGATVGSVYFDYKYWNQSCPNTETTWTYTITNFNLIPIPLCTLKIFWQGAATALTYIDYPSISYNFIDNGAPSSTTMSESFTTPGTINFLCSPTNPIESFILNIHDLDPGDQVIFTFKTYKCIVEDDNLLLNHPKTFNFWKVNFNFEDECGNWHPGSLSPSSSSVICGTNPTAISSNAYNAGQNLDQQLSFTPTITDMSVGSGNAPVFGTAENFYVDLNKLFTGLYDHELLGAINGAITNPASIIGEPNISGIMRVRITCSAGLRIENPGTDVNLINMLALGDPPLTLLAYHTSVNPANCEAGVYYYYYAVDGPSSMNFFTNGRLNFMLQPCCVASEPATYDVAFHLLPNSAMCNYNFVDNGPTMPATNTGEWLPLSSVSGQVQVHCPGCLAPGMIVDSYKMKRTTLGFVDSDNDGMADFPLDQWDESDAFYSSLQTIGSFHGDELSDCMVAHFQEGDPTATGVLGCGYNYSDMVSGPNGNASNVLDYLQLQRGMTNKDAMNLQLTGFDFYIDDDNPGACINCTSCGTGSSDFNTVFQMTTNTPSSYVDESQPDKLLFTFYEPDLIALSGGTFTGFAEGQRYRLICRYKVCGINDVGSGADPLVCEISNGMWLSGQQHAAFNPALQMPNTIPNPCSTYVFGSNYADDYQFYCETFGGMHYFYPQGMFYKIQDIEDKTSCTPTVILRTTVNAWLDQVQLFPFEIRTPSVAPTNWSITAPPDYEITDINVRTKFLYYNPIPIQDDILSSYVSIASALSLPQTSVTINNSIIGNLFSCADNITQAANNLCFSDNQLWLEFAVKLRITGSGCETPTLYTSFGSNFLSNFGENNSYCGYTNAVAPCTPFTEAVAIDNGNGETIQTPDANLSISIVTPSQTVATQEVCWLFQYSNIGGLSDAVNAFIQVPTLPYLTDWKIDINGTFYYPDANGYINFADVLINENGLTGYLCVKYIDCQGTANIPIVWGWGCSIPGSICGNVTQETLTITDVSVQIDADNPQAPTIYNLCEQFGLSYDFSPTSVNQVGQVYPTTVLVNALPGLTVNGLVIENCNTGQTYTYTGSGPIFTIGNSELAGIGYTNGLLDVSLSDCIRIRLLVEAGCGYTGALPTSVFQVYFKNYCNHPLSSAIATSFNDLPIPYGDNCGCDNCIGLSLNYIEKEKCNFSFNAIVPTNPICANSEVIWDFGDGGTDNGTSVSHQYLSNGSFMVCYTWRCLDSENQLIDSCVVCEKIIVDCASLDTFCLKIPKDFDRDIGEGIVVTPDGGFAVGGTLHEAGAGGDRDMFVVKYSPNITQDFFSTRGDKTGTVYKERGYSILARTDGYFVAGSVDMGSQEDVFVAKFKLDGTLDNGMRYGSSALRSEGAYRIIDMSSSGVEALLVVGYAEVANGDTNMLALKIDPTDLGLIAQNTYYYNSPTTISQEKAYDAVKTGWHTITDHYAIVGEQYETKTDKNVMVTLINTNLGLLQGKIYGSSKRNDIGYGIAAYDTSLFVTGSTSYDGNPDDLLILRMNIINLNYQQNAVFTHSSSTHEIGKKIIIDSDKNLVIAGTNWEGILTSGPDALALKVKPSNLSTAVWSRSTTLQPFSERFHSIAEYGSDYYVATGSYADAGAIADEDIFIVKMTKDSGFSCCLNPYTMVAKSTTYTTRPTDEKKISLKTSPHGLPDIFSGDDFICSAIVPWHMRLAGMEASTRIGTDITLFPNPNTGGFIIRLNNGAISENPYTVNIIDISGRVVAKYMKQANDNSQISIDASDVVSGIYFVEVINTELRWKSKVVIEK